MIRLRLARSLLLLIAVCQLLDVISTNAALAAGAGVEANPVMALAMACLGPFWWLWKAALAALFVYLAASVRDVGMTRLALISALAKIYVIVVISNFLI
jgi:hypothetical protein